MNWLLIAAAVIIIPLMLLVARGMYLIGSGSDAELEARAKMTGETSTTGWMMLDKLRNGEIPVIATIERKLGWGDDDE